MTACRLLLSHFILLAFVSLAGVPTQASSDGYTLCAMRRGECKCRPPGGDIGMFVTLDAARCTPSTPQVLSAPATAMPQTAVPKPAAVSTPAGSKANNPATTSAPPPAPVATAKAAAAPIKPAGGTPMPSPTASVAAGVASKNAGAATPATASAAMEPVAATTPVYDDGYTLCAIRRGECRCRPPGGDAGVLVTKEPARCVPNKWPAKTVAASDEADAGAKGLTNAAGKAAAATAPVGDIVKSVAVPSSVPGAAKSAAPVAEAPVATATAAEVTASAEPAKSGLNPASWLPSLGAAVAKLTPTPATSVQSASASYRLCARRSGSCTCQLDKDGPGEYSQVDDVHCQSPAQPATVAAGEAQPATGQAADKAGTVDNSKASGAKPDQKSRKPAAAPARAIASQAPLSPELMTPQLIRETAKNLNSASPGTALARAEAADEASRSAVPTPAAAKPTAEADWPTTTASVSLPTEDEGKSDVPLGSVVVGRIGQPKK